MKQLENYKRVYFTFHSFIQPEFIQLLVCAKHVADCAYLNLHDTPSWPSENRQEVETLRGYR